jgi:hypothetical protein
MFALQKDSAFRTAWGWWQSKRLRYNVALAIAGFSAFVMYAIEWGIWRDRMPREAEFTIVTLIVQAVAYVVVMIIANVFYTLGAVAELIIKPRNIQRFRDSSFRAGFWFSVALPFSIPLLVAIACIVNGK